VEVQQSASYFSGFHVATIAPRNRRFGGEFAIGFQASGVSSVIGLAFKQSRACERNVQLGDIDSGASR
jgi:hypothetical protein